MNDADRKEVVEVGKATARPERPLLAIASRAGHIERMRGYERARESTRAANHKESAATNRISLLVYCAPRRARSNQKPSGTNLRTDLTATEGCVATHVGSKFTLLKWICLPS
jgi:hypothetical protein